jgi:hypothetical protein
MASTFNPSSRKGGIDGAGKFSLTRMRKLTMKLCQRR